MVRVGKNLKAYVVQLPLKGPWATCHIILDVRKQLLFRNTVLSYNYFLLKELCALSEELGIVELMSCREAFPTLTACGSTAGFIHAEIWKGTGEGAQRSPR